MEYLSTKIGPPYLVTTQVQQYWDPLPQICHIDMHKQPTLVVNGSNFITTQ
jgi:hypothetical protein